MIKAGRFIATLGFVSALWGGSFGSISLRQNAVAAQEAAKSRDAATQEAASDQEVEATPDDLWDAARKGDLDRLCAVLDAGVDVNSKTRYRATALSYACDRGQTEIVRELIERGADVNVKDSFYQATPMTWALSGRHWEIVTLLVEGGAESVDQALQSALAQRKTDVATVLIESGKLTDRGVLAGRKLARSLKLEEISEMLDAIEVAESAVIEISSAQLDRLAGTYVGEGVRYRLENNDGTLTLVTPTGTKVALQPTSQTRFEYLAIRLDFDIKEEKSSGFKLTQGASTRSFARVDDDAVAADTTEAPQTTEDQAPAEVPATDEARARQMNLAVSSIHWPGFRGTGARGVAEGQNGPLTWNRETGHNIIWEAEIPGLGLSCPAIWGDFVFVTSAISDEDEAGLKIGHYGDVDSVEDNSEHEFAVFCINKLTGDEVWKRVAHVGVPAGKRHLKSSHANPTPATDGRYVVAFFGTQGIYCFDMAGNLAWQRDLGDLDSGWFYDASYQWGFGSSPIIVGDRVIVQCDIQAQSFIAALDIHTGEEVWRTDRDEIPTWSSPTFHRTADRNYLFTNGSRFARAYDADSGEELWRIGNNSEIVVPTPFVAHGLVYISSGYRPIQPIYAIRPDAEGDLTIGKPSADANSDDEAERDNEEATGESESGEAATQESNEPKVDQAIAWHTRRGGPYMPSPLVYGDFLYTCGNRGIVTCYHATTGQQMYKERLRVDNAKSFTASPIASDGRIYLTSEEGTTVVLKAGPEFEVLYENSVNENCLSTPAISEGMMIFRTQGHLVAVAQRDAVPEKSSDDAGDSSGDDE